MKKNRILPDKWLLNSQILQGKFKGHHVPHMVQMGKISWKKGKACLFKNLLRDAYSNPLMGLIKNDTFISSHPPFWIKDTNLIFQEHFSVKFFLVKQEKKRSILAVSYFGIMTRKDTLKLISASFPWNPLSLHRFIMKETRFIKSYHNGIILQNKDFLE